MLVFYLVALALGVGLIGAQSLGHHGHLGHHGGAAHGAWMFLSTRFWAFALLATGLIGTALTVFHLAGPVVTAALALPAGVAAGGGAHAALRALGGKEVATNASLDQAIGVIGRVLLPPAPGRDGKVRLLLKGQTVDVIAQTDEADLQKGASVVVAEVKDGVARVARAPKELEP